MLRKRLIFTLIYKDGFFHQSRNFRLQRVGNLRWLERNYKFKDIAFSLDEIVVLNTSQTQESLTEFASTLSALVEDVFIPIAAGGHIRKMEDARLLFENGMDKIVVNTILDSDKDLVRELVEHYGSQSVLASIDYREVDGVSTVYVNNGQTSTLQTLQNYVKEVEALGVGEIYLNSIEQDGTGFGYDIETIKTIANTLSIPLIIAGGAGNERHFEEGLSLDGVNAVATANLFNFIGDGLPNARKAILKKGFNIASWN
ncbi:Imidazole glycerol phosphate synthase cyclase subunit [hydrothermal vent metagenome]|uniref:Imidazole glycerol phosphate synthase cyclase subunit n=1 Tax=hydrothermal vent metagenome TaxID=652676 RepID=A0A1W1BBC1_9ZZZZ